VSNFRRRAVSQTDAATNTGCCSNCLRARFLERFWKSKQDTKPTEKTQGEICKGFSVAPKRFPERRIYIAKQPFKSAIMVPRINCAKNYFFQTISS